MQIKILFEKKRPNQNLCTGWGMSFLVDNTILFDTAEDGKMLLNNMQQLAVDIDKLNMVVISHEHWDHTGGLWELLRIKRLRVYGCLNFSKEFRQRVKNLNSEFIGIDKFTAIRNDIYLTGEISIVYKNAEVLEQALLVKTANGISVLTGCSHPGIINILNVVKSQFPMERLYLVMGGFHLNEQDSRLIRDIVEETKRLGVCRIGPTHCTGPEAEEVFRSVYKDNFIPIQIGQIIEI